MRACIIFLMSSNLGQIGPSSTKLAVLEPQKKNPSSYNGKRRHPIFLADFDQMFFILAGNEGIHKSLDALEIWVDPTTNYGVSCP